jgi:hypothetical protein
MLLTPQFSINNAKNAKEGCHLDSLTNKNTKLLEEVVQI